MREEDDLRNLLRALRDQVAFRARVGMKEFPMAPRESSPREPTTEEARAPAPAPGGEREMSRPGVTGPSAPPSPSLRPTPPPPPSPRELPILGQGQASLFEKSDLPFDPASPMTMEELDRAVAGCVRCRLSEGRTNLVFGVGDPKAELVFVGEAPGREEDLQGEPFVGRAGQLLTRMIEGMGMRREDVYICNVIKCRPPGNRDPLPEEVEKCEPYLIKQLEVLRPKAIVALGRFAIQSLLRTKAPIGKLRGQWHSYRGIPLMPTFHTAYLLRNPGETKLLKEDLQKVKELLGRR